MSYHTTSADSGDATYLDNEMLGAYKDLTYLECRDIYRYWPLGKRIATALPNFAMSAKRKFIVKDAPDEVNSALEESAAALQIDKVVKQATIYARIYGLSALYAAVSEPNYEALTMTDVQQQELVFNVLDPLSLGGSIVIDNNPLSPTFGKPINIQVQGYKVSPHRLAFIYNDIPLYYKFTPSSFSFSGPSIYQNMTLLIRSWNRCVIALQRLATKAAAMVKTTKDSANITGYAVNAARHNLELIRSIENDGIASIRQGDTIEFFNLTGVSEVDSIISSLNTALMMALSDTPSGILLDKNLSVGLNDGTEDMKAILMAVEHFRLSMLQPLYNFTDKFLCYKTFTAELAVKMKREYPDLYQEYSVTQIINTWLQDYSFEWGELYPQSENEKADSKDKFLDSLLKAKELGADTSSLEEELNAKAIFLSDMVLKEPAPETEGSFSISNSMEDSDGTPQDIDNFDGSNGNNRSTHNNFESFGGRE